MIHSNENTESCRSAVTAMESMPWLVSSEDKRITEDIDWRDEEDDPIEDEDQDSEQNDSEFRSTRSRHQKIDRFSERKKRKFI